MVELKSDKFLSIFYEPGKEIWVDPEESEMPFYFDVTDDLTDNCKAMEAIVSALDDVESLKVKAIKYLKEAVKNKENNEHQTIRYFLECHKEQFQDDALKKVLNIDNIGNLSFNKMIDCLKLKRFGSLVDENLGEQVFIMDLSFNPDYTDELMVVYFNLCKDILLITHES